MKCLRFNLEQKRIHSFINKNKFKFTKNIDRNPQRTTIGGFAKYY